MKITNLKKEIVKNMYAYIPQPKLHSQIHIFKLHIHIYIFNKSEWVFKKMLNYFANILG